MKNIYDNKEDLLGINLDKLTNLELDILYRKCVGECETIVLNEIDARNTDFTQE